MHGRRMPTIGLVVALMASFTLLYWEVMMKLVNDWTIDENYSHGFLIVPLALYFAWERKGAFLKADPRPSMLGLLIVAGSLSLLLIGILGAEVFTTEVSLVGTIAGCVLFLHGWRRLRVLLFPLMFLFLMIPIPAIIFNEITLPLQLLASQFAETILSTFNIPVLREGNVIYLANTTLEVAEACSGIRSLVSLLTLGIVYGVFAEPRQWMRSILALATVPVAIIANGFRVAGTGAAAYVYGPAAAEGFFHTFSGWLVFTASFVMLLIAHRVMNWWFPNAGNSPVILQDSPVVSTNS